MTAQGQSTAMTVGENRKYMDYKDRVFKIRPGAGGPTAPFTAFFPHTAHIKAGETVVWYNPSRVPEPHTVTFVFNEAQFANFRVYRQERRRISAADAGRKRRTGDNAPVLTTRP